MEVLQLTEDEPRVDFDRFVRKHQRMVWRYLRWMGADPIEADDLLQETFLRVPVGESGECDDEVPGAFLRPVAAFRGETRSLVITFISSRRVMTKPAIPPDWMRLVLSTFEEKISGCLKAQATSS